MVRHGGLRTIAARSADGIVALASGAVLVLDADRH
jgi:hypothetical protein